MKRINNQMMVEKIKHLTIANLDNESFSYKNVIADLGYTKSHVFRKIKLITGLSLSIYIREIRLEISQKLLLSTDLSVSEIAYLVGFKDPAYFTKCFTKLYKTSPLNYKKVNSILSFQFDNRVQNIEIIV